MIKFDGVSLAMGRVYQPHNEVLNSLVLTVFGEYLKEAGVIINVRYFPDRRQTVPRF